MFEHLAKHAKILVTGPHRSGTTFTARCIAHDTGHEFRAEERIHFDCRYLMQLHLEDERPFVIQCPFMAHIIHTFQQVMVVWVSRDKAAVTRSLNRMHNSQNGAQIRPQLMIEAMRKKYNAQGIGKDLYDIQYENWLVQRERLPNWEQVQYESLTRHPLYWAERNNFHVRQTETGQEIEKLPPYDPEPVIEVPAWHLWN